MKLTSPASSPLPPLRHNGGANATECHPASMMARRSSSSSSCSRCRPTSTSTRLLLVISCAVAVVLATWRSTIMTHRLLLYSSASVNKTTTEAMTPTFSADDDGASPPDVRWWASDPRRLAQVHNFRSGKGLLLHLHVTHHAGTAFCHAMGKTSQWVPSSSSSSHHTTVGAPPFACRIDRHKEMLHPNLTSDPRFFSRVPWYRNETQSMIELLRPYYHMVSVEFGHNRPSISLHHTDWEHPDLVSVFVSRHPMERMLSGDAYVGTHYKVLSKSNNHSRDDWWDFANMTAFGYVDNFMLRVLSNDMRCCQGVDTPRQRLEEAMELLERFTFVLDAACLDESMLALANVLGLDVNDSLKQTKRLHHLHHPDMSARYPYKDVYNYLVQKNQLDLELYRWTQERALVNCSSS